MKAVVLYGKEDLRVDDFPTPPLSDDAVKIRVEYCGICGTDIHKFKGQGGSRPMKLPVALGHEVSGIVVELGRHVSSFKIGDRVTVDPNWYCKTCDYCHQGKTHLCQHSRGVVKGMAEYICPPQENVYKLPDGLSLQDAALTEPISCCLHGIDLANLSSHSRVLLIGFGSIGMMMLELLKLYNSQVVVMDVDENKREKALDMGAFMFINSRTEDVEEILSAQHIDSVIECVGLKSSIESAIALAPKGSTVVIFGVANPHEMISFNAYSAFQKELTIKTSYINPYTTKRAIDILACGLIDTGSIISKIISMEDVSEEIVVQKHIRQGKVLVKITP